jgi:hypothetical protein
MLMTTFTESKYGGGKRDRTADLLLARQALSQLSYTPIFGLNGGADGTRTRDLRSDSPA